MPDDEAKSEIVNSSIVPRFENALNDSSEAENNVESTTYQSDLNSTFLASTNSTALDDARIFTSDTIDDTSTTSFSEIDVSSENDTATIDSNATISLILENSNVTTEETVAYTSGEPETSSLTSVPSGISTIQLILNSVDNSTEMFPENNTTDASNLVYTLFSENGLNSSTFDDDVSTPINVSEQTIQNVSEIVSRKPDDSQKSSSERSTTPQALLTETWKSAASSLETATAGTAPLNPTSSEDINNERFTTSQTLLPETRKSAKSSPGTVTVGTDLLKPTSSADIIHNASASPITVREISTSVELENGVATPINTEAAILGTNDSLLGESADQSFRNLSKTDNVDYSNGSSILHQYNITQNGTEPTLSNKAVGGDISLDTDDHIAFHNSPFEMHSEALLDELTDPREKVVKNTKSSDDEEDGGVGHDYYSWTEYEPPPSEAVVREHKRRDLRRYEYADDVKEDILELTVRGLPGSRVSLSGYGGDTFSMKGGSEMSHAQVSFDIE